MSVESDAGQRTSAELLIAAKAVVSWIQQSEFPMTDKLVFRNNVFRELLAINRREAEMRQVGYDTKLSCEVYNYSDINEACGQHKLFRLGLFSAPPYTEWYLWPQAEASWILEKKRKFWLKLKELHQRRKSRRQTEESGF